jgi:signal peptidase II
VNKQKKLAIVAAAIVVVCVCIDQIIKIWVKSHMGIGQTLPVLGEWFNLHFVENPGMAFGLSFGDNLGKLALSLLRIAVVGYLIYFLVKRLKNNEIGTLAVCFLSLIVAGALGNIIDSAFYGIAYGYAPFMYGRVVDMFYIQLFRIPDWFPGFGGQYFFPAVFNFADACVTVGIFAMIIFYKRLFNNEKQEEEAETEENSNAENGGTPMEDEKGGEMMEAADNAESSADNGESLVE